MTAAWERGRYEKSLLKPLPLLKPPRLILLRKPLRSLKQQLLKTLRSLNPPLPRKKHRRLRRPFHSQPNRRLQHPRLFRHSTESHNTPPLHVNQWEL